MSRRVVSIVLLALLAVGAMVTVGFYEYRVGLARRLEASENLLPGSGGWPAWPYPYGGHFHPFGLLFPLLFLFLILTVARRLFWWGRPGGWRSCRQDLPAQLDEWHRKAHESMASGETS